MPVPLPTLSFRLIADGLVFEWTGPFVLQRALMVQGPYCDLSSATPYVQDCVRIPQAFFRLIRRESLEVR